MTAGELHILRILLRARGQLVAAAALEAETQRYSTARGVWALRQKIQDQRPFRYIKGRYGLGYYVTFTLPAADAEASAAR